MTTTLLPGEAHGVHYHFVSSDAMAQCLTRGEFLEHAEVHGKLYGTSKSAVAAVRCTGRIAILDIDVQGVRQIKTHGTPLHSVFVTIPSLEALETRLRAR